jgi:hypothetical protein
VYALLYYFLQLYILFSQSIRVLFRKWLGFRIILLYSLHYFSLPLLNQLMPFWSKTQTGHGITRQYMQLLDWDLHPIFKRLKPYVQERSTTLYLGNHDCTSILEFGYTNDSTWGLRQQWEPAKISLLLLLTLLRSVLECYFADNLLLVSFRVSLLVHKLIGLVAWYVFNWSHNIQLTKERNHAIIFYFNPHSHI